MALVCALLLQLRKTEKRNNVGHVDNKSNLLKKKIVVPTKSLEDVTITCLRHSQSKTSFSFVVSQIYVLI